MDAHYDQVMKAREEAPEGTRLYFAYSTILDRAAFEEWREQHGYQFFSLPEGKLAEATDVDLIFDFPSRWWGGRVAGLAHRPGHSVFGLLFSIDAKDWPVIQHKEGAVTGMCVEWELSVKVNGETLRATAFTTNPARVSIEGPISPRFLEAMERGARSANLPEPYVARLRAGPWK